MELSELQSLCQHTLQDFNLCMFYEPPQRDAQWAEDAQDFGAGYDDEEDEGGWDPGDPLACLYLDDGIVFKMVCCLICTIHLLEKSGAFHFLCEVNLQNDDTSDSST